MLPIMGGGQPEPGRFQYTASTARTNSATVRRLQILMAVDLFWLVVSIGILVSGAELLVRSSGRLAVRWGVPTFVIGVTVVGFGTSAPELAASIASATSGHGQIAIGNVIGSNIMNIALVLGVTAMLAPIPVVRRIVRREVLATIVISFAPLLALLDDRWIDRPIAMLYIIGLLAFLAWSFRSSRDGDPLPIESEIPDRPEDSGSARNLVFDLAIVVASIGLLVVGADTLVDAATGLARAFGVSELVIGLTIVAGGTSAPELATSLVAVARGKTDLGVGNVLGSCIFNLLGILGVTALVVPLRIPPEVFLFDLPVMILTALACIPIMLSGHRIGRVEGAALFVGFVVYTTLLFVGWPFPADRSTSTAETVGWVDSQRTAASIQPPPSTRSPS